MVQKMFLFGRGLPVPVACDRVRVVHRALPYRAAIFSRKKKGIHTNQLVRAPSTDAVLYSTLSFSSRSLEQSMEPWTPVGMKSQYPAPRPRSSWPPFSSADRSSWGRCLFISPEDKRHGLAESPARSWHAGVPDLEPTDLGRL